MPYHLATAPDFIARVSSTDSAEKRQVADMETLEGFCSALGTCHPPCHPLAALGLAMPFGPPTRDPSLVASPFGDFGTCTFPTTPARYARALALGLARWSGLSKDRPLPTRLGTGTEG